jgi:hypothetical protein
MLSSLGGEGMQAFNKDDEDDMLEELEELDEADDEQKKKYKIKGLSILPGYSLGAANEEPEFLYNENMDIDDDTACEAIIEQNGIHIINSNLFNPTSEIEAGLNQDFRELVDSVIG